MGDVSLSNLMKYSTGPSGRPGSPSGAQYDMASKHFSQSAYSPRTGASDRDRYALDHQNLGYGHENFSQSHHNMGYGALHGRTLDYQGGSQNLGLDSDMRQRIENLKKSYQSDVLRKQVLEKEQQKFEAKYQADGSHKYPEKSQKGPQKDKNDGLQKYRIDESSLNKMDRYKNDGLQKYRIDESSLNKMDRYKTEGLHDADHKKVSKDRPGYDTSKHYQKSDDDFQQFKHKYDIEDLNRQALEQSYSNQDQLRRGSNVSTRQRLLEDDDDDDVRHRERTHDIDLRRRSSHIDRHRGMIFDDETSSSRHRTTKKGSLVANLSGTKYDAIIQILEQRGFTISKTEVSSANLIWNDSFVSTERVAELKPFQRINHFPGMGEITRKDFLARNIKKVQESHRKDYSFIPETWLPSEHASLLSYAKESKAKKKSKTFILKPSNRAQGHGIELYTNAEKIPSSENFIVQEYIDRPFLLDHYKFDLRLYVLITSCDPLRVYLFKDGLVRLSTEKYRPPDEENLKHKFMHLTNYSVNKHNQDYQRGHTADSGSKRSVQYFLRHVAERTDHNVGQLWQNISDIIIKTLIIGLPQMYTSYKLCRPGSNIGSDSVCFELLGFDFLLDWNLNPWLIEVNRSPSFGIDEDVDLQIKPTLIDDTVKLLHIRASDKDRSMRVQKGDPEKRLHSPTKHIDEHTKRKDDLNELLQQIRNVTFQEEFEKNNCGHFQRIFPVEDKSRQGHFVKLIMSVTNIIMPDRASTLEREFKRMYSNRPTEDSLLEMIAQCKMDSKYGKGDKDKNKDDSGSSKRKSKTKNTTSTLENNSTNYVSPVDEDNLTKKTLLALKKAKVKFPGKSEKESELFLDKMHEKWKIHKERIGTFWLVKLDATKREKVIDIVRSTVRAAIQPIWPDDIDNLPLYRTFNRIFSRMLSSHGQGLWNCFSSNKSASSWEAIVSKSSTVVSDMELSCCRRVVELCQDCLVIVYQFTADAEAFTI